MTPISKLLLMLSLLMTCFSASAWDGMVTGTIVRIEGVGGVGGAPGNYDLRVYLTGMPQICSSGSTWGYLNATDPNYKALLALLLSAQLSGKSVTLYTNIVGGYCEIGYMALNT